MATRHFSDSDGVEWTVWMTRPSAGSVLRSEFADGWLTFQSSTGRRRRLAPVPATWETCPCEELDALCRRALAVASRDTPVRGTLAHDVPDATGLQPPREAT